MAPDKAARVSRPYESKDILILHTQATYYFKSGAGHALGPSVPRPPLPALAAAVLRTRHNLSPVWLRGRAWPKICLALGSTNLSY